MPMAWDGYSCKTVVGLDWAKQYATTSYTSGKWFGWFMKKARMNMGMIRKHNKALISALVMAAYVWRRRPVATHRLVMSQGRNWRT